MLPVELEVLAESLSGFGLPGPAGEWSCSPDAERSQTRSSS